MRFMQIGAGLVVASLFGAGLQAQSGASQTVTQAAPGGAASQMGATSQANSAAPTEGVGDEFSAEFMAQHVPELLEKAKTTSDGTASLVMKRYPGNYLNLMVRVRTGIGEMHANWSDILVCIDGEADVITGGTLVDRKDQGRDGESRGSRSEGGVHHMMHKGDVIHILPNTPHWTVLEPGKNFVFWAVKIQTPQAIRATAQ
jgi:hypothetical protein